MSIPAPESIQIILPILTVTFLIIGFFRPIFGTIAYMITMSLQLGGMYPALGAIRFELVVAVIVFIQIGINGKNFSFAFPAKSPINKALWVLFIVCTASFVLSVDTAESWEVGYYQLIKDVLLYIMIVLSIKKFSDVKILLYGFLLISFWTAYEPMAYYFSDSVDVYSYGAVATGRFGAMAGHVALANSLCQALPVAYFLAHSVERKGTKLFLWFLFALMIAGVVVTKSRGGFIGLIAFGLGAVYFAEQRKKAAFVFAVLVILALPLAGQQYMDRISTIADGIDHGKSTSDRYWGFVHGISMMIKRPLLGVGIGCYAKARSMYFGYYFFAHNLYGELIGELGLASVFWFYWIYSIFKQATKLKRRLLEAARARPLLIAVINSVMLGLAVRLILGNFTHSATIWFWYFNAAVITSLHTMELFDEEAEKA